MANSTRVRGTAKDAVENPSCHPVFKQGSRKYGVGIRENIELPGSSYQGSLRLLQRGEELHQRMIMFNHEGHEDHEE